MPVDRFTKDREAISLGTALPWTAEHDPGEPHIQRIVDCTGQLVCVVEDRQFDADFICAASRLLPQQLSAVPGKLSQ